MELPGAIWFALSMLIGFIILEVFYSKNLNEGFANLVGVVDSSGEKNFFSEFAPKRGDIGFEMEEKTYTQDPRYFKGYVDVQRFGLKNDFCRMVVPKDDSLTVSDKTNAFFACALAGTSGLSSVSYRTKNVSQGFVISRDDYMRDIHNENRFSYCRIIRGKDNVFEPICLRAGDLAFTDTNEVDPLPPDDIKLLLEFYSGCITWLRLRDDMIDYVNNLIVHTSGGITIPEVPNPAVTQGISFNGVDQYLRVSDAPDLTLGKKINMRTVRSFSVWVYFDSFTNNAHIFDFGDGAGNNNTFLGILGKGDETVSDADLRPLLCGSQQATIPDYPSGPHPCNETTPQNLMLLKANVNEYECKLFDVIPSKMESSGVQKLQKIYSKKATLLYEVWDSKQRKMRIKVNGAIPEKKWTHIAITAKSNDAFRPDIGVYVNGTQIYLEPSGFLPQARSTTNNYIGKSNWADQTSQYDLRDELLNGKMFDFRMYNNILSDDKIMKTISWGNNLLGLK